MSFDYFRSRTASFITGNTKSSFWTRLVLQASQLYPVVRHASLALGTITRADFKDNQELKVIAIQQYNKAIRLSRTETQPTDAALICCIIFIAMEVLWRNYGSAYATLIGGMKMLYPEEFPHLFQMDETPKIDVDAEIRHLCTRLVSQADSYTEMSDQDISQVYTRLSTQAAVYGDVAQGFGRGYRPFFEHERRLRARLQSLSLPGGFESLEQAQVMLDDNIYSCYRFLRTIGDYYRYHSEDDVPLEVSSNLQSYIACLKRWMEAFELFLGKQSKTLDTKDLKTALHLKIHYSIMFLMMSCCFPVEETAFDKFIDVFKDIISWSKSLRLQSDSGTRASLSEEFSVEMGIIHPLSMTVLKCRDPVIRREAISILQSSRWREGVWDSHIAAGIAAIVMGIEEEGLGEIQTCSDIPEQKRIFAIDSSINNTKHSIAFQCAHRPNGMDGPVALEVKKFYW
ncbi:hypothetical protein MMC20_002021 [Loxospora ochrophaea]|nr:hypothetical protein [Loxospora ochrophaea]